MMFHIEIGDDMKEVILKPMDTKIDITAAFDAFMEKDKQLIAYKDGSYYALKEVSDGVYRWLSLVCSNSYWSSLDTSSERKSVIEWVRHTMKDMERVWLLEQPEDLAKIFQ